MRIAKHERTKYIVLSDEEFKELTKAVHERIIEEEGVKPKEVWTAGDVKSAVLWTEEGFFHEFRVISETDFEKMTYYPVAGFKIRKPE